MEKLKRILAALGALILFAMYGITLFFAITDRSGTMDLLMASIACTAILSVLLYAYSLFYKLVRDKQSDPEQNETVPSDQNCQAPEDHT